ncbi:MAG: hypothetical protein HQL82_03145 [Magnetococcales bacterium]|nr:hypothetical protein [Magnetococcales bacterium]
MSEEHPDPIFRQLKDRAGTWHTRLAATARFDSLTESHREWAAAVIEDFVEAMYAYHNSPPEKWTPHTLTQCCIRTMPGKVEADDDYFHAIGPVLHALFDHLEAEGELPNAAALSRAAAKVDFRVIDADEGGRWGFARALVEGARAGGYDPLDPHQMETFIDQLNSGGIEGHLPGFQQVSCDPPRRPSNPPPGRGRRARGAGRPPAAILHGQARRMALEGRSHASIPIHMRALIREHPRLLLDCLHALEDLFGGSPDHDPELVESYLHLLTYQLTEVGFGLERNYKWAQKLREAFHNEILAGARAGDLSPSLVAALLGVMEEARLPADGELLTAYEALIGRRAPPLPPSSVESLDQLIQEMVDAAAGDPFDICEVLQSFLGTMPGDSRPHGLKVLGLSRLPEVTGALPLLALSRDAALRRSTLEWLAPQAETITPETLRRLIVLRNWLPAGERGRLDQVTRAARRGGVACAQWAPGESLDRQVASTMDGAGALGFLSITRVGRRSRLSSVLAKRTVGILDAWRAPLDRKAVVQERIQEARRSMELVPVDTSYLTLLVKHHLHVGLLAGSPPPLGLLQVAEILGATQWLPEPLDFDTRMADLIESGNAGTLGLDLEDAILAGSGQWGLLPGVTDSWYVEHQAVVDFLTRNRIRNRDRLAERLLDGFFEPDRQSWAERCAWTALWLQAQPPRRGSLQALDYNFAVLARTLLAGRPMARIPLMHQLALRTIQVLGTERA